MKKQLIAVSILTLALATQAHSKDVKFPEGRKLASAKSITKIFFGMDGLNDEYPEKGAKKKAKAVYDAMGGGNINFGDETFECQVTANAFNLALADNAGDMKPSNETKAKANVSISGEPARAIFAKLPPPDDRAVGAEKRKVANITCTQTSGRNFPTTCRFSNVFVHTQALE